MERRYAHTRGILAALLCLGLGVLPALAACGGTAADSLEQGLDAVEDATVTGEEEDTNMARTYGNDLREGTSALTVAPTAAGSPTTPRGLERVFAGQA